MTVEYQKGNEIFECRQCGSCCNGFGGTCVTKKDILKISSYIQSDPDTFMNRYCVPSGSRYVLTLGKDGSCIFFDRTRQCTIHPIKPYMCKAWPFIQPVINHPENWNMMASACPGMKKHIPYKDLKKIVRFKKETLDSSIKMHEE